MLSLSSFQSGGSAFKIREAEGGERQHRGVSKEHGLGFSRLISKYWLDINLLNYSAQLGGCIIFDTINVHISARDIVILTAGCKDRSIPHR